MKVLDLFCGAGGAGEGYRRAGHEVTGVDIEEHDYPVGQFVQVDAVEYLKEHGHEYEIIHASPPCQRYSTMTNAAARDKHPDLVPVMQDLLPGYGVPYVIENVMGAPLVSPVKLCGSMFGLKVRRHRLFEANFPLVQPKCAHKAQGQTVGVYGNREIREYRRPDGSRRGRKASSTLEAGEAMGIDWMSWEDLKEAIPPAYTQWIADSIPVTP